MTQEMCDKAFEENPSSLIYVPDWFVRPQQVNLWYDDYYNDDSYGVVIKWHNSYQKHKAQKAKINEEVLSIACHLSRWWDWCMSGDKKKETEKLWK